MDRPGFLNRDTAFPYLSIILMVGSSLLLVWLFSSFVWPLFLGIVMYVAFEGVHQKILAFTRGRTGLAALLSMLFVLIILFGPITLLFRLLILEAVDVAFKLKDIMGSDDVLRWLPLVPSFADPVTSEPFFWVDLQDTVLHIVDRYTSFLDPDKLGSVLGNASSFLFASMAVTITLVVNLLFALILLFFLFRDGKAFYAFVEEVLPIPQDRLAIFVQRLNSSLRAVVRGNLFVSILQGTALGLGIYFCGLSRGLLFGAVAAIFSLIPVVGTAVVWLPVALYLAFVENAYGLAAFMAIYGPTVYLILENIVKPKVLDRELGIHPLFLFFAILGGISEFGITGVIIGPIMVTVFVTLWSIMPRRAPSITAP